MRFAIVGAGQAGRLRARALSRVPGCQVVVAADVDHSHAEAICTDATADYRQAVERRDVDAVIVSTPPNLHTEVASAALEAGKHVLCEKPLAPNLEECKAILTAASRANRVVATGFNHRYFPNVEFVRQVILSGQIGNVRHVRAYAGHPGESEFRNRWEHSAEIIGGGTLMDNGIHLIDLVRFLGGEFDETAGEVQPGTDAEPNAFGLLRANDGRIAELASSWNEWRGYRFHIDVYGERGMARAYYGPLLALVATDRKSWRVFPAANLREKLFGWQATATAAMARELHDFVRQVSGDTSSGASGYDGLRAVEIAHAVYRSALNRQRVSLSGAE